MGQVFNVYTYMPQAEKLWRSGQVPMDTFRRHAVKLRDRSGVNPHVKQV